MGDMTRVVVVGGSAAGMAAAAKAKRVDPSLDVIVFEKGGYVSYAPCGIPYYISGLVRDIDELVYYKLNYFIEKRGLDVRIHHLVTDIDPDNKVVYVKDLKNGNEYSVSYDKLMLATGGVPIKPPIDGVDLDGIHTLRLLEDGYSFRARVNKAKTVAIVGAGYIGIEVAEALRSLNKRVLVFEMLDQVMPSLDKEAAKLVEEELVRNSVELHLGEKVVAFEGGEEVKKIVTTKDSYPVDLVLMAVGVKPNVDLARRIGVELGETGAIKVNEMMETNIMDIYAGGDNTEAINLVTGKPTYIPLAPAANKMGRVAGENMAGGEARFPGVVGTSIVKAFDLEIGKTGLSLREALEYGFDAVAVDIWHGVKSHYYPGFSKMYLRLVADRDTHRVLGIQAVGREGVLARVNTVATALMAGMRTEELKMLDLAYAPPFAPVWDPIIVAANVVERYY